MGFVMAPMELTRDTSLKKTLVAYNIEDCRALSVATEAVAQICATDNAAVGAKLAPIKVEFSDVTYQRTFGRFSGAYPDFEKINSAAYWDYQRSKVYVRTCNVSGRNRNKNIMARKKPVVMKDIIVADRPSICLRCGSNKIWISERRSQIVFDVRFTRGGIKRWVVRYKYSNYRCGSCAAECTIFARGSKYAENIRS